MKELSVVIVSYNTRKLLEECFSSLFVSLKTANLLGKSEVIVVDNYSKDGSIQMVEKKFPQVTLIKNRQNLGFGNACNQGIGKAQGTYILLLNSDTIVFPETISNSLKVVKNRLDVAILGCRLLNEDYSLQYSAGYFPSLPRVFFWMFFIDDLPIVKSLIKAYHEEDPEFYNKEHEVDWVMGAFFLIRKEATDNNLFDPKVFMYVEEVEYCFRIKKEGWKILYTPSACLIHKKGGSAGNKEAGILEEFLGLRYFYRKHYSGFSFFLLKLILAFGALLRIIVFGIMGGSETKRKIYYQYLKLAGR